MTSRLILRELLKGLNAAARSLENPFGIAFVGALTAREGLSLIERDGEVQIVIVDDKLYAAPDGKGATVGRPTASAACRSRRSSWCRRSPRCVPNWTSTS